MESNFDELAEPVENTVKVEIQCLTPPSAEQLDKLRPVMQELAEERKTSLEDIFIKYMDLASLVLAKKDEKFKEDMQDFDVTEF